MSWLKEMQGLARLTRRQPGGLVVYAEAASDRAFLEDMVAGLPHTWVSSDPSEQSAVYLSRLLPAWLARMDARVLLVTVPDLGRLTLPKPPRTRCVYAFHSLASVHRIYREGAFEHYDDFLCAGPHHVEELRAWFSLRGLAVPELHEVGYPRLDRVAAAARSAGGGVLVAPSWHASNLLAVCGEALVGGLLARGLRVVVRPHPCFFDAALYPQGRAVVERVAAVPGVVMDLDVGSERPFLEADVMVSDWSGAAFEYAFGTERPVVFVDVPPKVNNPSWEALGIVPFEERMRTSVGRVVDAGGVVDAVVDMLAAREGWRERIVSCRQGAVYEFGRSAGRCASVLEAMLAEG